ISALLAAPGAKATAIRAVSAAEFQKNPESFVSAAQAAWLQASGWTAKPGSHALLPGPGGLDGVILALGEEQPSPAAASQLGALPAALPEGTYALADFPGSKDDAALAWLMGAYSFRRYLTSEPRKLCKLVLPKGADRARILANAQAIWFARELINLPANDLGPSSVADALCDLGRAYGAGVSVISGQELLNRNFPLIHAVAPASDRH